MAWSTRAGMLALVLVVGGTVASGVAVGKGIIGDHTSEVIRGTKHRNAIQGYGGSDRIYGLGGNDRLIDDDFARPPKGGYGDDTLRGGTGDDDLYAGRGSDRLLGGPGDDVLEEYVSRGRDRDRLIGGDGDDDLIENDEKGNNLLNGGAGVDVCMRQPTDRTRGCEAIGHWGDGRAVCERGCRILKARHPSWFN